MRKCSRIWQVNGSPREAVFHPPCKYSNQLRKLWKRRARKNGVKTYFISFLSYSWICSNWPAEVKLKALLLIGTSLPALCTPRCCFFFFLSPGSPILRIIKTNAVFLQRAQLNKCRCIKEEDAKSYWRHSRTRETQGHKTTTRLSNLQQHVNQAA